MRDAGNGNILKNRKNTEETNEILIWNFPFIRIEK